MLFRIILLCVLWTWAWMACSTSTSEQEKNAGDGSVTSSEFGDDAAGPGPEPVSPELLPEPPPEVTFVLRSSAFKNNKSIPNKYGCEKDGSFQKPSIPLEWSGVPPETKSFVLLVDDITPLGRQWVHWAVINIPVSVTSLPEGASGKDMPKAAKELKNTWQQTGYGGPCPPTDIHAYRFRLFAMPTETVEVIDSAQSSEIVKQLPKPLGVAEIRGTYPE